MKIKHIVILIALIYVTGIIFLLFSLDIRADEEPDIIEINRIVKITEKNWGKPVDKSIYGNTRLDFTLIDSNEKVIYSTKNLSAISIYEAVKERAVILDVTVNALPAGKVIIHNDYREVLKSAVTRVYVIAFVTFTAIALLCIFYILYINSTVFKPFSKLQRFARNVAAGNLDIPLEMDRKNLFGAFSESFDMMREELEKARKSEYLANLSKKELIAGLSHDIKTPVSSIKAISELMLVLASGEKERQRLNTIYYKAEQINLLVNDMFHATLEELNELKVTIREELSTVLADIIHNANYFDRITHDPIPQCILSTDTLRLQQVFDNVLGNSYKYANTAVYIAFRMTDDYLEVHITDSGPGVSPDELPLLFNKFHRGRNAQGQSGSGLGLYISKYFMNKMNGDILCQNLEKGFKVTLKLKLA